MEKLRKRLKEEYFKDMEVDLSDDNIRLFANNVWSHFTSERDYFIIMPISPMAGLTKIENNLKKPRHGFKIVSPDVFKTIKAGEMGFIVSIDWTKTDKVYMPEDMLKTKYIEVVPEIRAVYSVNNGEGILSSSYERAKTLSEILDIPFKSYDKHDFDPTYEMNFEELVNDVICAYILKTQGSLDLNLRDRLINKYGNDIIVAFRLLKKENAFTDEGFMNKIISYISEHENIKK